MPPIYITEQGAKIRIQNNRIHIERPSGDRSETLYQAPIGTVSQVVLSGNVGLTTPAIAAFLERQIDVVFLDSHGNFRGRLLSGADPHTSLRRAQLHASEDQGFVLNMARCLIRAKLKHQHTLLRRCGRDRHDPVLAGAVLELSKAESSLEDRLTLNALRGAEGSAAAAYFSGFRQLFGPEWCFHARRHHPSPDPVNAMLSYGYTLLTQAAVSAVRTAGLDPYIGFLHEEAWNRPSLALDLMEEFRPVVDGIVLRCCHTQMIRPADFEKDQDLSLMSASARRTFISAFEERMSQRHLHPVTQTNLTLRQCLAEQARQIAFCCENAPMLPEYKAMGFR